MNQFSMVKKSVKAQQSNLKFTRSPKDSNIKNKQDKEDVKTNINDLPEELINFIMGE